MSALVLPPDYNRIKLVSSFDELVTTPFENGVNALCWQRDLPGDFAEIVECLGAGEGIVPLDEETLLGLSLSEAGTAARNIMLEDQRLLCSRELEPELDCVYSCERDPGDGPVATDVYSFHADSATVEADTFLCTYIGATSEGLRNDEARRRVDIPETRAALLKIFGGEDNDEFREFLNENCFDLHYSPLPQARPFGFGLGNLWRIATEYRGSPVPPCIHRAPETLPGQPPRLLLIS